MIVITLFLRQTASWLGRALASAGRKPPPGLPTLGPSGDGVFAPLPAPDRHDPAEPGQVYVAAVDAGRGPGGADADDMRHPAGGQTSPTALIPCASSCRRTPAADESPPACEARVQPPRAGPVAAAPPVRERSRRPRSSHLSPAFHQPQPVQLQEIPGGRGVALPAAWGEGQQSKKEIT